MTSSTIKFAVIAPTIALVGCHLPPHGKAFIARDAASLLMCPQKEVQVFDVSTSVRQAVGCGRSELYVNVNVLNDAWRDTWDLRQRAAFDLRCSSDSLALSPLSSSGLPQIGVSGCDRTAVYAMIQTSVGTLNWVMEDTSRTYTPAPPSANR
jgi:hypothetical protein